MALRASNSLLSDDWQWPRGQKAVERASQDQQGAEKPRGHRVLRERIVNAHCSADLVGVFHVVMSGRDERQECSPCIYSGYVDLRHR